MTVADMLNRISSRELTEWMCYYDIDPFGTDTQYLGPAITSSVMANLNRKKGTKAFNASDFMPKFNEKKKPQSTDQMIATARMLTAAFGGTVKTKK